MKKKSLCNLQTCDLVSGCSFSLVSKVKELLKSKGHKLPSSRSAGSPAKQTLLDVHDDSSLMDRSEEGMFVIEDDDDDTELSNSGITHSEVAALNGSHDRFEEDEVFTVRFSPFLFNFEVTPKQLQKNEMVEDYQLDSSSISQYLQNRSEVWNPLSIECPTMLGPSMVKVTASVESPPQTKTFTVLGPAATAPLDPSHSLPSGTNIFTLFNFILY